MIPHVDKEGYQWYGCGHTLKGVIITDSNILTISAYLTWKDTVGFDGDKSMCFNCYCEETLKSDWADDKADDNIVLVNSISNDELDIWLCKICQTRIPRKKGSEKPTCEYCRRVKEKAKN